MEKSFAELIVLLTEEEKHNLLLLLQKILSGNTSL